MAEKYQQIANKLLFRDPINVVVGACYCLVDMLLSNL